ncbi:hypothetical protein MXB_1494, partial [Myxobolus squamalis]
FIILCSSAHTVRCTHILKNYSTAFSLVWQLKAWSFLRHFYYVNIFFSKIATTLLPYLKYEDINLSKITFFDIKINTQISTIVSDFSDHLKRNLILLYREGNAG